MSFNKYDHGNSRHRQQNMNKAGVSISRNTLINDEEAPQHFQGLVGSAGQNEHGYFDTYGGDRNSEKAAGNGLIRDGFSTSSSRIALRQRAIRPTLITGFNNGYNFSNNFINSPVEHTILQTSSDDSQLIYNSSSVDPQSVYDSAYNILRDASEVEASETTVTSLNTPITIINKNLQSLQNDMYVDSVGHSSLNHGILGDSGFLAPKDVATYRTQPNSFDDSFIDPAQLAPFNKENEQVSSEVSNEDSISNEPIGYQCSTLLERDFPAEILPFELLDKKDGSYFINSDKISTLPSSNYHSLIDHEDMFSDIINPLSDARPKRMRTEKRREKKTDAQPEKTELTKKHRTRPRTYSESETANFSMVTGERLYDDDKHRPIYSLDGNHEKLQDDSIHSTRNNSNIRLGKRPTVYSGLDIESASALQSPYDMSRSNSNAAGSGDDTSVQVPTNITLHGGTIVPDENYRPKFMPRNSYNKAFGLAKTHQISTSTIELLHPEKPSSGQRLHPNVEIYNNFQSLLGCEDEYIPGLDFKTSITQWFDNGKDYNRFYELQLIGSHVHDKGDEAALRTIDSIRTVKSFDNQDELTLDVPNHEDNPTLADPPHDYSYREIALDAEEKQPLREGFIHSHKSKNQNLKNYRKDILNFNEYDYNNLYGGHDKLKHIPPFILSKDKQAPTTVPSIQENEKSDYDIAASITKSGKGILTSPNTSISDPLFEALMPKSRDADELFNIHSKFGKPAASDIVVLDSKSSSVSTPSRRHPVAKENITPQKRSIKLEYGTVIEDNVTSSASSSLSSSPLVLNDLKTRFRLYNTDKLLNQRGKPVADIKKTDNDNVPSKEESKLNDRETTVTPEVESKPQEPVKKVDYERLIDKLPDDFLQLPFSKRRKLLLEILPPNDEHNKIDSKLLLTLIKKRFAKKGDSPVELTQSNSTAAAKFLSRVNKAPAKKRNIDDRGSIVMNHELGKIIGYGSWGIVRECYSLDEADNTIAPNSADGTHRLVRAIKIVKTKNEIVKKCFKKEIRIWKLLNHKRLLPLLFVKETSYAIFCITPRIYGGTLFDIVSNWGYYNDPNSPIIISKRLLLVRRFIWEILDGLSYMHYNGIVHGDLKLENCLIDEIINPITNKIENHILICDFGMSCFYIDPERSRKNFTSSARNSFTRLDSMARSNLLTDAVYNQNTFSNRPQIPRSSSSENLSVSFNKMHKILFNKTITHDDTPAGISSFQKDYGPAPTSTTLNLSPIIFNYIQNEQPSNDKTPLPHTHIGSLPYASPEILLPNPPPLGPMADIWAFGVLTYTMVVGKLPFQHNFEPRLRAMISRGKYDIQCLQVASGSDPALVEVIKGCLTKDITARWDLETIVLTLEK